MLTSPTALLTHRGPRVNAHTSFKIAYQITVSFSALRVRQQINLLTRMIYFVYRAKGIIR